MNLSFGKLTAKNFQSFKDLQLDFGNLKNTTTLVMGENRDDEFATSNGSGKSVILEAVSWALFGTTFRPLRYADEVINLQENSCDVVLDVVLDNKTITVFRSKTKNKSTLLRIFDDETELLKDSDTKAKQAQLESIIGFNFETFTNSVMFHLDYVAFPELKPAQRAEILTEIANLEVYVEAASLAKARSNQIISEVSSANIQSSAIMKTVEQLEQQQSDFENQIKLWEDLKIADIRKVRREMIVLKQEQNVKQANLDELIKKSDIKIVTLKDSSDKLQDEIKVLSENLDEEIDKNEKRVIQLTKEETREASEINSLKNEVTRHNKEITSLKSLEGGKCPTCQQNVTTKHTDTCVEIVLKKVTAIQTQIAEKSAIYERLRASKTQVNDELMKYKNRRTKANVLIVQFNAVVRETVKEESDNQIRKNQLYNLNNTTAKLLSSMEETLDKLTSSVNPYILMKDKNDKVLAIRRKEVDDLEVEVMSLEDERQYIDFYIDGFKKIKLMLFDDLVNRLNELTQEYLSRYTSELSVRISCERQTKTGTKDELHIEIDRPEGSISYAAYSGGERQKIKLSVSLALAQVIEEMCDRSCNFVFFDEPNNGLDSLGKRSNFEVFQDLTNQGNAVIVIDHDAYFQDSFENVITVVKENGYSTLTVN